MGLFKKIFGRSPKNIGQQSYQTLTAYQPAFRSWGGQIYESELVRAAIHARAKHMSKLRPVFVGAGERSAVSRLKLRPNSWQTWAKFLYQVSTILDVQNTCFIVPVSDEFGQLEGIFPLLPSRCEVIDFNGQPWLRYELSSGKHASMEYSRCGVMTKHQYSDVFFGEDNTALSDTMEMINVQHQGIAEAVKNGATARFLAQSSNFMNDEDIKKERERFNKTNLQGEGGIIIASNKITNIQQIKSQPFTVQPEEMRLIQTNVFNYYGVNEDVLQNKTVGDSWSAFYEGECESFAIQASEVITPMIYTDRERQLGNEFMLTANRLQYMSNKEKAEVSKEMADRGIFNRDEVREIWNLEPLPDGQGQAYTIRGEYYLLNPDGTITKKDDTKIKEEEEE